MERAPLRYPHSPQKALLHTHHHRTVLANHHRFLSIRTNHQHFSYSFSWILFLESLCLQ